jgi:signal transduction histidine kinase
VAEERDLLAGRDGPHLWKEPATDLQKDAANDREDSADDRLGSAQDRKASAHDRSEASQERDASADAAQRALETLESMSDAFFSLDFEWRFTYVNPQAEVILHRSRANLVGKNMWDEFPEGVNTSFFDGYLKAMNDRVSVRVEETYEPLGRTLEVRAYPVAAGLAVYFTDVTDERHRDGRLRQTERLETLGRATAGVAHDFNNLLTAVSGFAELGQSASSDTAISGYFEEINSASQKARALTRQLLTFARKQDLSPAVIFIDEVVAELSTLLRQLLPPGVELLIISSSDPVPVFVDRSQFEQVLLNLVVNSRDAIDESGSIRVRTLNEAPTDVDHEIRTPSGWLEVTDDGSGIPTDIQPHIFDPFFSTKPLDEGTGLGLATTYGIVAQSGGSILVESTVGVGTTMTVVLPRAAPGEAPL